MGNGKVIFAFTSPYNPNEAEINNWLRQHGDGVREVAFKVDDATAIFNKAV